MELKKIQQAWDNFPEMSMEERPILSSDLEKIVIANPFPPAFFLKPKIMARIFISGVLWFITIFQLRQQFRDNGNDVSQLVVLFLLLSYCIYFHIRLLLFADYPSLLSLSLLPFLNRVETVLDKFIFSFGIISAISGFYLLAGIEKILSRVAGNAALSINENGFLKWLIIIFLSVSFYILLLNTLILKYKKLLTAVRTYRGGIGAKSQKL